MGNLLTSSGRRRAGIDIQAALPYFGGRFVPVVCPEGEPILQPEVRSCMSATQGQIAAKVKKVHRRGSNDSKAVRTKKKTAKVPRCRNGAKTSNKHKTGSQSNFGASNRRGNRSRQGAGDSSITNSIGVKEVSTAGTTTIRSSVRRGLYPGMIIRPFFGYALSTHPQPLLRGMVKRLLPNPRTPCVPYSSCSSRDLSRSSSRVACHSSTHGSNNDGAAATRALSGNSSSNKNHDRRLDKRQWFGHLPNMHLRPLMRGIVQFLLPRPRNPCSPAHISSNGSSGSRYSDGRARHISTSGSSTSGDAAALRTGSSSSSSKQSPDMAKQLMRDHLLTVDLAALAGGSTGKFLGNGSYGSVRLFWLSVPRHLADQLAAAEMVTAGNKVPVVLKNINHDGGSSLQTCRAEAAVAREVSSSSSKFPFLYAAWHGDNSSCLIYEAVSAQPQNLALMIYTAAKAQQPISVKLVLNVMTSLVMGLNDLHQCNRLHLDLKPNNVVMGDCSKAYIVDLGSSQAIGTTLSGYVGTFGYMDPAIFHAGKMKEELQADTSQDLFSLGMSMVHVLVRGCEEALESVYNTAYGAYCIQDSSLLRDVGRELRPYLRQLVDDWEQYLMQTQDLKRGAHLPKRQELLQGLQDCVEGLLHPDPEQRRLRGQQLLQELQSLREACEP